LSVSAARAGTTTLRLRDTAGLAHLDIPVVVTGTDTQLGEWDVVLSNILYAGKAAQGFTNGDMEVTFDLTPAAGYSLGGFGLKDSESKQQAKTAGNAISFSENGPYTVVFYSTNGHEYEHTFTISGIDKEKPVFSWSIADNLLSFTASDTGVSGLASVTVNGVERLPGDKIGDGSCMGSYGFNADGEVTVIVRDRAGNEYSESVAVKAKGSGVSGGGPSAGSTSASLSLSGASPGFDKNPASDGYKDIRVTLSSGSYTLSGILLNGKLLTRGKDYTLSPSFEQKSAAGMTSQVGCNIINQKQVKYRLNG
jgi:hypothetical protein